MNLPRSVLLVTPRSSLVSAVAPFLQSADCRLLVARTFHTAKTQLAKSQQLLITDLKLGEFNGLQLALRSLGLGVPVIVIAEKSFEADIEQIGAVWMSPESAASDEIFTVVTRLLSNRPSPPPEAEFAWAPADDTDNVSNRNSAPTVH